jgi:hypothetical protein
MKISHQGLKVEEQGHWKSLTEKWITEENGNTRNKEGSGCIVADKASNPV